LKTGNGFERVSTFGFPLQVMLDVGDIFDLKKKNTQPKNKQQKNNYGSNLTVSAAFD
jgi:hypothetical protein